MSYRTDLVDRKGRIQYVEPNNFNKYGMELGSDRSIAHPYEDYCISVDLTVSIPDINSCGMPENNGGVELVYSTKNSSISFLNGTNGFLTTSYTDIDLLHPLDSNGNSKNTECLGIESININYDSYFYPVIRIVFVDVRGASLMLPEEQAMYNTISKEINDANKNGSKIQNDITRISGGSFFKALFSYPRPIFKLKVKGFYGREVTYDLAISNFSASFDSSNGNFRINTDFIGYMYGIFTDIPMTYLAVAPYIKTFGQSYWRHNIENGRFMYLNNQGVGEVLTTGTAPMDTFMSFKKRISTIEEGARKALGNIEEGKKYKEAKTILSALSNFGFRYNSESKLDDDGLSTWNYNNSNNGSLYYFITRFQGEYDEIYNNEYEKLDMINKRIKSFKSSYPSEGISNLDDLVNSNNFTKKKLNPYCSFTINELDNNGSGNTRYVLNVTGVDADGQKSKIIELAQKFPALKQLIFVSSGDEGVLKNAATSNSNFKFAIYTLSTQHDHRKEIDELKKKKEDEISSLTDAITEIYNNEVRNSLGFEPTIQNIYDMSFAQLETFMACFYNCLKDIDDSKQSRTLRQLGIQKSDTDLSDGYKDDASIPPFPAFSKKIEKDGQEVRQYVFPTDVDPKLASMPEVKFVDSIINASRMLDCISGDNSIDIVSNPGSNNEVSTKGLIPTTLYDIMQYTSMENPYQYIVDNLMFGSINVVRNLAWVFVLRCYYYILVNGYVYNEGLRTFGYSEACNFYKALNKRGMVGSAKQGLTDYLFKQYILNDSVNLNKITNIIKDELTSNLNRWYFNGEMSLELNGDNTVSYHRSDNLLPIGEFNFNKWVTDFGNEEKTSDGRYINLNEILENNNTVKIYTNPTRIDDTIKKVGSFTISKYDTDENSVKSPSILNSNLYSLHYDKKNLYGKDLYISNDEDSTNNGITVSLMCECNNSISESQFYNKYINVSKIFGINGEDTYISMDTSTANERVGFSNQLFNQIYNEQNNNMSKAYLLLFALRNDSNSFLKNKGHNNGTFLNIELLKEGAHYWRYDNIQDTNIEHEIDITANIVKSATYIEDIKLESDNSNPYDKNYNEYVIKPWNCLTIASNNRKIQKIEITYNTSSSSYATWGTVYNNINSLQWDSPDAPEDKEVHITKIIVTVSDIIDPISHTGLKGAGRNDIYTITNDVSERYNGLALIGISESTKYTTFNTELVNKSRRNKLKSMFTSWVAGNIGYLPSFFELERALLMESTRAISTKENVNGSKTIVFDSSKLSYLYQNKIMSSLYTVSTIIDGAELSALTLNVSMDSLSKSFGYFIACLAGLYEEKDKLADTSISNQKSEDEQTTLNDNDLRLSVYLTLKHLYDTWLCNYSFSTWKIREKGSKFYNFRYIDNYYRNIGYKLYVNCSHVESLISSFCATPINNSPENKNNSSSQSLFEFLQAIATKNGSVLYSIPVMFGMTDSENITDLFDTKPYSSNVMDDTSTFLFVYSHKPSQYLDIKNDDGRGKANDGFDLGDTKGMINPLLPDVFTNNNSDDYIIPAFGVTFAKGNQSYFTNFRLDTNNPTVTEYSILTTLDVVGKGAQGPKSSVVVGQDLYRIFSNYSYTCTVEMMGDMQITPLMYFQLNNVPLWKGAYRIIKVQHSISAGQSKTTFTGIRECKNATPIVKGKYLYVTSDMNWSDTLEPNAQPTVIYNDDFGTKVSRLTTEYINRGDRAKASWFKAFRNDNGTVKVYDEKTIKGYCTRFTYYMAGYYAKLKEFDATQPCGHSAAYSESYWNALVNEFGYVRCDVADHISKEKLMDFLRNDNNYAPGDIVVYYRGDTLAENYHTQIYIDSYISGKYIKWASSSPDNHSNGVASNSYFVYKSSSCDDWMFRKFTAPSVS